MAQQRYPSACERRRQQQQMLLLGVLVMALCATPQRAAAMTPTELDTALRKGCATILESAVYRTMYENMAILDPKVAYATFTDAVCSLPYDTENQELGDLTTPGAKQGFQKAAQVLVIPSEYKRFMSQGGLNNPNYATTNTYFVVRNYFAAVCLGLMVQETLSVVNNNYLTTSSILGSEDTIMEAYNSEERGCLQSVERNGISYTRVSEIGDLPLVFNMVYTPPKTDLAAARTNDFIPENAPCVITDANGIQVDNVGAPIEFGKRYKVTCNLPQKDRNNGQWTQATLAINLAGNFLRGDKKYYMLLFNGRVPFSPPPSPNPPPSPSPSPPPPPSPRPPAPPTPPPPSCASWFPPECKQVITNSVLQSLSNITLLAKVVKNLEQDVADLKAGSGSVRVAPSSSGSGGPSSSDFAALKQLVLQQAASIKSLQDMVNQQQGTIDSQAAEIRDLKANGGWEAAPTGSGASSLTPDEVLAATRICIGDVCLSSTTTNNNEPSLMVTNKIDNTQSQIEAYRICIGTDICLEPGYGSVSVIGKPGNGEFDGRVAAMFSVNTNDQWANPFEVYLNRDGASPRFFVSSQSAVDENGAQAFGSD